MRWIPALGALAAAAAACGPSTTAVRTPPPIVPPAAAPVGAPLLPRVVLAADEPDVMMPPASLHDRDPRDPPTAAQ